MYIYIYICIYIYIYICIYSHTANVPNIEILYQSFLLPLKPTQVCNRNSH